MPVDVVTPVTVSELPTTPPIVTALRRAAAPVTSRAVLAVFATFTVSELAAIVTAILKEEVVLTSSPSVGTPVLMPTWPVNDETDRRLP